MRFSEVAGHREIKQRLIESTRKGRVPHAQLFHGASGNGSLPLTLAYATYLSCTDKQEDDSCGKCPSCIKYDKLVHPDLHFVYPVFTGKNVSSNPVSDDYIEEWRTFLLDNPYMTLQQWYGNLGVENKQGIINKFEAEAILRKLNLKAYEADHKILIMWMPEKMNAPASNKLLKMIEEPPPMTVFLLVAEDTRQILPTVLSRTQLIKVPRISSEDLMEALVRDYPEGGAMLEEAVKLAEGNLATALEIMAMSEESEYHLELFIRIMRLTYSRKWQEIFSWVEEVSALGRERQKAFLSYAVRMVRENFLLNTGQKELVRISKPENDFSERFSAFIHEGNVGRIIEEIERAIVHIEANAYARIVFLDFAMILAKLIR